MRADERSRFLFFAGLFTLITLGQTMGLAGSEALFLARLGVEQLPATFILAAASTVVASTLYALRVGSVRNDTILLQMLVVSSLLLGFFTWAAETGRTWGIYLLFCSYFATQTILQNHFWTFSGDYFDRLSAKRLVHLFMIGSSLGGTIGGLLGAALAWVGGAVTLLVAWALVLAAVAVMVRAGRRPLRRWGPLELQEADETSMEGMRSALRYLGNSPLSRWLVVSALGMVLAYYLAQYLYSGIFVERYADEVELAIFLSLLLAITNGVEIGFEVSVTPRLIRARGVPGANLAHPLVTLLSFVFLAASYGLASGVFARLSREMLDNAVAAPVRSLMQNAIPSRFRGRMRAFLEGMVVYAGMAVAGLVLLLLEDPPLLWLCAAGVGASLVYLLAAWEARRAYLDTLVGQLKAGRLDLGGEGENLGAWEASRLADLWEAALGAENPWPSSSLGQLVRTLADKGILDPLVRAASHPNADVRRSSLTALASTGDPRVAGPLALALDDPDAPVRLAALRGLARARVDARFFETRIDDLLHDLDPNVRAEAAAMAGEAGLEILTKMIGSPQESDAVAALRVAPSKLLDRAIERVQAPDPRVRAAALECAARLAEEPPLELRALLELLVDANALVRRAAVLVLAGYEDAEALQALAGCLTDPSLDVQFAAEAVLAERGDEGVSAVDTFLSSENARAVLGAARVVSRSGVPDARQILAFELRRRVGQIWWCLSSYQQLPRNDTLPVRFLRLVFRDLMLREQRLAFGILELLENETVIQKVQRELRVGTSLSRADALEVLSNLGDRQTARMLVLVHESGPLDDRMRHVDGLVNLPADRDEILAAARRSEVRWLRVAAQAFDPQPGDPPPQEDTMQRLLALKRVELFANLSLEQLEAVSQVTQEVEYLPGEIILREGEHGETLYLLLEGEVEIVKDHGTRHARTLTELVPVAYFGEMAILDNAPRAATAVARSHARLLTLDGGGLKSLILQIPEISFEIFPALTARVRKAERRLSELESKLRGG
ncbi:MAG: cyclic nucleotide-binding domain-containing protein [Myxococcota bacterium]|nr:cyclic nucleotide-binding domain-containing protein [Myxococcota bacterium]